MNINLEKALNTWLELSGLTIKELASRESVTTPYILQTVTNKNLPIKRVDQLAGYFNISARQFIKSGL